MGGIKFTDRAARLIGQTVRKVARMGSDLTPTAGNKYDEVLAQTMFAVKCTVDGGNPGSLTETCSFTYTVESYSGNFEFGTELTPEKCRQVNTRFLEPPEGSRGYGCWDESGEFELLEVICEIPDAGGVCEEEEP